MKRVIVANRLDDVIRQEQEFNAKLAPYEEKYEKQMEAYRKAGRAIDHEIEDSILQKIGPTDLDLQVRVDPRYHDGEYEVRIEANTNHSDPTKALSWNWSAKIDNGELSFDSGSWSGLKAVTPEQIDDLEESVRVLRILLNMDWEILLRRNPEELAYDRWVDRENSKQLYTLKGQKPDFSQMKREAQIADLIGTNKIIKVSGLPDDNYRGGYYNGYIKLLSESPSAYNVMFIPRYDVDFFKEGRKSLADVLNHYTSRKKKANVLKAFDGEIVDLDEIVPAQEV